MRIASFLGPRGGSSSGGNGGASARARLQGFLVLLLALNALMLLLVLRPPGRSAEERQAELRQTRAHFDALRDSVRQMRELQEKLQGAIQNGQQFSRQSFLPRRRAFSEMIEDLEQVAAQSRLRSSGVSYDLQDEPERGLVSVTTTISVQGAYPDLVRFINRLEQSQLFWIIGGMNVTGTPGEDLRLSLQMETYLLTS